MKMNLSSAMFDMNTHVIVFPHIFSVKLKGGLQKSLF